MQLTLGLNAFITAQGFAKTGMLSVLIGAVINIVLDPIFIFGLHMGVRGAALATIISQACSCIWVVSFLFGKKTFLKIQRKNMKLEARIILPSLALGLATFIMQASESIITVCFNSSLLKYGGDIAVGAMTILTSVMQFAMLPLQGLGQGAQPILSYNYGAKNVDRVRGTFRLLLKVSVGYAVILWLCVELFPQIFVSMFTSDAALLAWQDSTSCIYGSNVYVWNPDRMPDGIYLSWLRTRIHYCGSNEEIRTVDSTDLYCSTYLECRSNYGSISGRTDCRFLRSNIHHDPVQ